jgi:acyl-CoA thioester hydrolase
MSRVKIQLPEQFSFQCSIPVRITDINYGGHVGNDTVLSIIHEARMQYFKSLGYAEMNVGGAGTIMADVAVEFKNELFYGDIVVASVTAGELSKIGFDLFYKLETLRQVKGDKMVLVAAAKTGIICYDYEKKKIITVPEEARKKLQYAIGNRQ